MFKKSPLKATKIVKRRRKILVLKIGGVVGAVVILLALVAWVVRLQVFSLDTVEVEGNAAVDTADIAQVAHTQLAGTYAMLIPRKNTFFYPEHSIITNTLALSPRIQSVALDVRNNTLHMQIVEREPAYTWCAGSPASHDADNCYFLDAQGFIFSESPVFSGNAFFALYGLIPTENPIGQTYLKGDSLHNINELITFLNSKNLRSYAFYAEDENMYELYLESGGKIIFKETQDISVITSNLDLIIKNTDIFSSQATSTLEYVDLRFGNKLYFKRAGDMTVHTSP